MTSDVDAHLERARQGLRELRVELAAPSAEGRLENLAANIAADLRGAADRLRDGDRRADVAARVAGLRTELAAAAELTARGCRLYDGWMQVLCLSKSGYTAHGEPAGVSVASRLDVRA